MRGSPLLRAALVAAAMLLLLVPLHRLTSHPGAAPAPIAAADPPALSQVRLALTSTHAPFQFEISHLGRPIWSGEAASHEIEKTLALPVPKEGIDLYIDASWEGSGPAALKVAVTPEPAGGTAKTLWGSGSISEVLTFP